MYGTFDTIMLVSLQKHTNSFREKKAVNTSTMDTVVFNKLPKYSVLENKEMFYNTE